MKLLNITLFLIVILGFFACKCGGVDCAGDNGRLFDFISKTSSNDLLFGENKIYKFEKLKIYSLEGSDTVNHYFNKSPRYLTTDTFLSVGFNFNASGIVYLQLDEFDTDTINLTFNKQDSECCGILYDIKSIYYNGDTVPGFEFVVYK